MSRSFLLRFLTDGAGRAAMVLLTLLLARVFPVETYGRFVYALAYAGFLGILAELGLHLPFLREVSRLPLPVRGVPPDESSADRWAATWSEFFTAKLLLALGVSVLGPLGGLWFWPWENPAVPAMVVGWVVGQSLVDFFNQACNSLDQIETAALITLVHRGLCLLSAAGAFLAIPSLASVSAGLCLGSLLGALTAYWIAGKRFPFPLRFVWRPRAALSWLRASLPLAAGSLCSAAYLRMGILFLPWLNRGDEVGILGPAFKIYEAGYMVPAAFIAVALPRLSRTRAQNPAGLGAQMRRMGGAVLVMAVLWLVLGQALAGPGLRLLFGPAYDASLPLLRVLLIAGALVCVNYYLAHLLVLFNRLKSQAAIEGATLVFAAAATYFWTSGRGAVGSAWALVSVQAWLLLLTASTLAVLRRELKRSGATPSGSPA